VPGLRWWARSRIQAAGRVFASAASKPGPGGMHIVRLLASGAHVRGGARASPGRSSQRPPTRIVGCPKRFRVSPSRSGSACVLDCARPLRPARRAQLWRVVTAHRRSVSPRPAREPPLQRRSPNMPPGQHCSALTPSARELLDRNKDLVQTQASLQPETDVVRSFRILRQTATRSEGSSSRDDAHSTRDSEPGAGTVSPVDQPANMFTALAT